MSKQRDIKTSLFDILEASKNSIDFIGKMNFSEFEKDLKTVSAVLHQIMIIGEATKRLDEQFMKKHSVLPWKQMAGTRDVLIHHYEEADLSIVWDIVKKQLPVVRKEIGRILSDLDK